MAVPRKSKAKAKKQPAPTTHPEAWQPSAEDRATFLAFSALLTGFAPLDLEGTGLVTSYLQQLNGAVGAGVCAQLLAAARRALAAPDPEEAVRTQLWPSPLLGPVVQNLIQVWYLGKWNPLPAQWQEKYQWPSTQPLGSVWWAPPNGYIESLVWKAIGAHPAGARPTGFASWSEKPVESAGVIQIAAAAKGGAR